MTASADLYKVLHDWVVAATGLAGNKVVKYNPNAPEPTGQMFVINPHISITPIGLMDEVQYPESGVYSATGHNHQLASFNCYGLGALDQMTAVRACQDAPSIRALFKAEKLALVECGAIRNLTGLKGPRMEERAQMDVRLRHATTITDTVETTKAVELEIEAVDIILDVEEDSITDLIVSDDYDPTP